MRFSLLLLSLALLIGWSSPLALAQPGDGATLRLALPEDIISLDPGRLSPYQYDARDLIENLFVGLAAHEPDANGLASGLAASWEVSEDGLTWTFHLRDDINWVRHNPATGETAVLRPVTADDLVYTLQRACSAVTGSRYATSIFIIDGCQVLYRADPRFLTPAFVAERLGVRALDARTVQYKLLFPAAYFLTFTAMPEFRPLPREYVDVPTAWAEQGSIVTNGPFVLAEWVHSHHMTLLRNPYWPEPFAGNVTRVEITFEPDVPAALAQFNAGQIDRMYAPAGAAPPEQTGRVIRPSVIVMGFSMERAPVDERGVRQALAWSVDRAALAAQVLAPGAGVPVTQFAPPGMVAAPVDAIGQGYNPDLARQAFANAGHLNCNSIPEQIEFMVSDTPQAQAIAEFIVASWQRELGCNPGLFTITPAPFTTVRDNARDAYSDDVDYKRPHVWLLSWTADYYDANDWYFGPLHCREGVFRTDPACDETDALIDTAGVQYDLAARARMYADIEDRWFGVAGEYPVVPLYAAAQPIAQQSWLRAGAVGPARFDRWSIDTAARGD
ncbi:MAG: peptide ABC transporter substrate-binding protein [Anaerolineae bacterium]|nr:peptide ABC transporter substrate-binding protein [Anaerolineae bacterium]